ncbi:tRNA threonylcarbamoyladenosine biosynthesis protein TsaE [Balneicella halophila]|uniref:tRNA threonylcarbamoyladenosine biosynthesis protein TsaE n=1 Tax=Balneicella halophila TaxID=1537566 RepID=A0A7L4URX1_BALHA|nr:tRNA (adenosine(37)-N6)-threonylcarbamoyltransferase complex ATPase subunit type 1 TsaE [Balneicella halophila]PVX52242.1 tRNA threonylcarbamoyladenosine biosynthesis protein TsaE [Balneicella halophila]
MSVVSKTYRANSLEGLLEVADKFLQDWGEHKLVTLIGEMGAGKTTFVKAICDVLGVEDAVSSPTFSIINEYTTANGETLFHFDFYRINDEQEALDFGVEEYWESDAYCYMEWPEKVENILPEDILEVRIKEETDGTRLISVFKH